MFPECSPPEAQAAMLSQLSMFAGWQLSASCPRCRLIRRVLISDLATQVPADTLVKDLVARLRCQTCATPPDWVCLADGVEGRGRKVQRIQLVESGPAASTPSP